MPQSVRINIPIDDNIEAGSMIKVFADKCDGVVDETTPIYIGRIRPRNSSNHAWLRTSWLQGQWLKPCGHGGWLEGLWLQHPHLGNQDLFSAVVGPFTGPAGSNGYLTLRAKLYDKDGRVSSTTPPDIRVNLSSAPSPPFNFRSYTLNGGQLTIEGSASRDLVNDDGSAH